MRIIIIIFSKSVYLQRCIAREVKFSYDGGLVRPPKGSIGDEWESVSDFAKKSEKKIIFEI